MADERMSSEGEADMERVEKCAQQLGEHFDTVQILVSRHEPGTEDGTVNISYGLGNWFARFGQVRDWLIKTDERTREYVRREDE